MEGSKRIFVTLVIGAEILLGIIAVGYTYKRVSTKEDSRASIPMVRLARNSFFFNPDGNAEGYYEPIAFHREMQIAESWMVNPITYTINSDTLNERFDYALFKPPHTFRIVTLGDSFTFGMYVNTYENYSERLEDMLNTVAPCDSVRKFEVINLGVPGYDMHFETIRYALRGKKYQPDLVIWHIQGRNLMERAEFVFSENQRIVAQKEAQGLRGRALVLAASDEVSREVDRRYGGEASVVAFQTDKVWSFLQSLPNPRVLILIDSRMGDYYSQQIEALASHFPNVATHRLPAIDQLADTHPSSLGHQQIASNVFSYLRNSGLIDRCAK